ncbi:MULTISPECIES: protein-L-isoaspartate O-methyltransferase family protein [Sinorhizobium]|uniref:Protein-L-isoaspartate O-methyltransferase n=1 Tax=Sinorhizobium americanum TaxID=194963 RepID=A0A2S3YVX1_9HYPH|nr:MULTISPECIES: protein-L-isoaspartate O-methyltransferase [Sinorhizobium]PDT39857.1 protein-L-isoaspartate O-methyltransferase [Sinorhizobium sp. FG01]POH35778.1 protein-L-isoaspartate O-methyltransferase [Sinorhizobium americanum]
MNFEAARIKMVDNQIRTTDVTSHSVLTAFLSVPREEFVPAKMKELAYIDMDIELVGGATPRYLMEPSPLAKLLQLAQITKADKVLEIGSGTGYASSLLSLIAGSVVALESDEALAAAATETLARLGYGSVKVVGGDLSKGYAAEAPYDVIFINGAVETIPASLFEQLRDGGRLVAVEGFGNASRAKLYVRESGRTSERSDFNTSVKPLPGFNRERSFIF